MGEGNLALSGNRHFAWFKPAKRSPSEYESYTLGQQSTPERWLHVGWPIRFDDGRPPFSEDSTRIKCATWEAYRDPAQVWQRPYVASINHEQQTLARLLDSELTDGVAARINPIWLREILGKYFAIWPFVEYGQFLSLCYAVREALADTLTFVIAFEAADKIRYAQNIVGLILQLGETAPGYSDAGARDAWMNDPILVPLRENLEFIFSSPDWVEILVAIDLVLEPLAGGLMKSEFMARNAAFNGDPVTPLILASERADSKRHLNATTALIQHICADPEHGEANRATLREWITHWTAKSDRAAQALRGIFEIKGIVVEPFDPCYARVRKQHQAILQQLGF